jgi:hypothetical protein
MHHFYCISYPQVLNGTFFRELDFIVGKKALPENEQIFLLSSRGTGVSTQT